MKHFPTDNMQPQFNKEKLIKTAIGYLLIAFFLAWAFSSCSTQRSGCYATRGMSGYHSR